MSLQQNSAYIAQRLSGLSDEVIRLKLLPGIPADLTTNKNQRTARGDTVGVAFCHSPIGGMEFLHHGRISIGLWLLQFETLQLAGFGTR